MTEELRAVGSDVRMSDMERAALEVLRVAALLYNDAEILRDAIECDEYDQFIVDYIRSEMDRTRTSADELKQAVNEMLTTFEKMVPR